LIEVLKWRLTFCKVFVNKLSRDLHFIYILFTLKEGRKEGRKEGIKMGGNKSHPNSLF